MEGTHFDSTPVSLNDEVTDYTIKGPVPAKNRHIVSFTLVLCSIWIYSICQDGCGINTLLLWGI